MKNAHSSIVKRIITCEERVFVFTNPMNPTAVNAQDPRHLIANQDSLRNFLRWACRSTTGTFSQNVWLNIWIISQNLCLNQVPSYTRSYLFTKNGMLSSVIWLMEENFCCSNTLSVYLEFLSCTSTYIYLQRWQCSCNKRFFH